METKHICPSKLWIQVHGPRKNNSIKKIVWKTVQNLLAVALRRADGAAEPQKRRRRWGRRRRWRENAPRNVQPAEHFN